MFIISTLEAPNPQHGQTHSNNLAVAAELFECVWQFCGVDAQRVKKKELILHEIKCFSYTSHQTLFLKVTYLLLSHLCVMYKSKEILQFKHQSYLKNYITSKFVLYWHKCK